MMQSEFQQLAEDARRATSRLRGQLNDRLAREAPDSDAFLPIERARDAAEKASLLADDASRAVGRMLQAAVPKIPRGEGPLHGRRVRLPGFTPPVMLTLRHEYDDQYVGVEDNGTAFARKSEEEWTPFLLPIGVDTPAVSPGDGGPVFGNIHLPRTMGGGRKPSPGAGGQVRNRPTFRGRG